MSLLIFSTSKIPHFGTEEIEDAESAEHSLKFNHKVHKEDNCDARYNETQWKIGSQPTCSTSTCWCYTLWHNI